MSNQKKEKFSDIKINTNILFLLYCLAFIFVFIYDLANFINYILKCNIINSIILYVLTLPLIILIVKKFFYFELLELNIYNILVILVFIFLTLLKLPLPDQSYDTVNYHIFLQQTGFVDNINRNFFPAVWGTYLFPLGDRLFYLFRILLGYRAGTLLNTFVLIVMYFQIISIVKDYTRVRNINFNTPLVSFISLLILSTEFIFLNLSIYKVDLLFIPFLLHLMQIILFNKNYNKFMSLYIAFLCGLVIAIKLIGIIFVVILLLFYITKHRKEINVYSYLISFVIAIIPVSIYLIYNYKSTNNPIFPLYNNIFSTPYFLSANTTNILFGPKNLIETLLWPIYIFFVPNRISEFGIYSGRISLGFISLILFIFILYFKKNLRNKFYYEINLIFLFCLVLWGFSTGYIRYALFIEILSGFIILIVLLEYILSSNFFLKLTGIILVILLLFQSIVSYYFVTIKNYDWAWRPSIFQNSQIYFQNFFMSGKDRTNLSDNLLLKDVQIWILNEFNSGYAILLKDNIPLLNLIFINQTHKTREAYNKCLEKYKNKKMFTITTSDTFEDIESKLKIHGFNIIQINTIEPDFLLKNKKLYLLEISKNNTDKRNSKEENLISNGSFEYMGTGWHIPDVGQLINNSDAIDGKNFVKASVDMPITQSLPVEPYKVYELAFYSRITENNNKLTRLQINWYKGDDFINCTIKVIESTKEWKKHSITTLSPDKANKAIVFITSHEKYYIDFDDVTFCKLKDNL